MTKGLGMRGESGDPADGQRLDGLIRRYGGRVPRYTSYPTALQFSADVTEADYRTWLAALSRANGPLSIYLHIPFCAELCWYCGCHTKVARTLGPVVEYVNVLLSEIDRVAAALPERLAIGAIHFGGGTPNTLGPDDLARIVAKLAEKFDLAADADIAVELDPRLLTEEWAAAAARLGVRRASLGVQDFCPDVQAAIHRVQPVETVERAVKALRGAGVASVHFDLIYGLPRQTLQSMEATIDAAMRLAPDRLSLFGYAHVPWMKPNQKLIKEEELPGARVRLLMQRHAATLIVAAGFKRLGLDHFARPDDPLSQCAEDQRLRRNFQGYTADAANVLLGFGASAIGRLPQGYVQNAAQSVAWGGLLAADHLPIVRGVTFTADDHLRGTIIERLMCDFSVDLAQFVASRDDVETRFESEYAALRDMAQDGIVNLAGTRIEVTEDGRDFIRSVCAVFDRYLDRRANRHAPSI